MGDRRARSVGGRKDAQGSYLIAVRDKMLEKRTVL